ncbi:uncharacterized protein SPAPADRAFT_135104 [Spathaspora passalidarum NRRL Y-27907]|uniref:Ribosome-recycling factor, mitochondrial n=1 Tax=Spathaspora passalidarum (strain NRRL Y-27907 / 11-Y1) TaxID=619300 RepID=G3AHW2_SPAPN|nr:uncharacterized protein SPAPADRAFT_135104 [Spathaspora passalidarum NRRL Y-27907]EGW34276.1 hypothetical protein SPAPADRAFT_135104 [Spathaspora passalidarum NRRL Y-27907]
MFRSIVRVIPRAFAQPRLIPRTITPLAQFHTTPIVFSQKRKSKKGKKDEPLEEDVEAPKIDLSDATKKFDSVIEKFSKQATQVKLGKTDPRIFDNLKVNIHNDLVPFTSLASTSVKGRHFIITLFDPAYGKHIINALIDSDLNMSGQLDPANKFTLKVPVPSITTELKKENAKQLKEIYEKFKVGKTNSLAAVRSDIRTKFLKDAKSSKIGDEETKTLDEFEKLHKSYTDKLTNVFKTTEASILK